MSIKDFIISSLKQISSEIDSIKFIYNFSIETNTHIIFVSPSEFRINNDLYINFENDLWKTIFRDYPNDDVLITDNREYEIYNDNTIIITNN